VNARTAKGPGATVWKTNIDDRVPLALSDYPKGPLLAEWRTSDLGVKKDEAVEPDSTTKKHFELMASYNWVPLGPKEGKAVLVVPGLPARWTPPPLPAWLTPDTGLWFIDQNGYRNPSSPLEPTLLSLFILQPTFDPNSLDLITDRNNLRKLFRFVRGNKPGNCMFDFKMHIEVVNKTVLLTRWEKKSAHITAPGQFHGFGHSFEQEFTKNTKGLEESTSHNRIARYRFGGLNIMLRFSADAFLSSKVMEEEMNTSATASPTVEKETVPQEGNQPLEAPSPRCTAVSTRSKDGTEIEQENKLNGKPTNSALATIQDTNELVDLLSTALTLEPAAKPEAPPPQDISRLQRKIQVVHAGMLMPQQRVVEIKIRSEKRIIDLTDQIPQLWFSNTSSLYVGYHNNGSITQVDTKVMGAKALVDWESQDENKNDLAKMGELLRKIVDLARGLKDGKGQLVAVKGDMRLYENAEGEFVGALPTYMRERWGPPVEEEEEDLIFF